MRVFIKLFVNIAMVAILTFSVVACSRNPFQGTWTNCDDPWAMADVTAVIRSRTFEITLDIPINLYEELIETWTGTYTRRGNTATFTFTDEFGDSETLSATVDGNTLTIGYMLLTRQR